MSIDRTPNIFSFGTSELTQDAFISWICEWADPKYKEVNPELNIIAIRLLEKFFSMHGKTLPEIEKLKVVSQWMRIDVFIEVNKEYFVIIEDKVHSREHSDQLNRYREVIKKDIKVDDERILPIYFKTGDQSSYHKAKEAGYEVLQRRDFLKILREGPESGVQNAIYLEYLKYLERIEKEVERYKEQNPKNWNNSQWRGFFKYLNMEFDSSNNWGYVPNHSGGFMGFWWNRKGDIQGHDIYLQIEGPKLCFKISTTPEGKVVDKQIKWDWIKRIRQVANHLNLPVDKPKRLGHGKWVTFAQWHSQDSETWIPTNENGSPDLEQAVKRLQSAAKLLDKTVQSYGNV